MKPTMQPDVSRGTLDTIAALATPAGRGGVGVVRISGPDVGKVIAGVAGRNSLLPRHATLTKFLATADQVIDQGVAIWYPAPHSYTGENVLELQGHGGPAVMDLLLRRCLELGCRIARPGEFTERAFLNGKLDLAQAEGVADLIEAGSAEAVRSAARTLVGEFSNRVNAINKVLVELRIQAEAGIDFPEEEIDLETRRAQQHKLNETSADLAQLISAARQGAALLEGLTVVLIGRPNVGKSSLLNRLAGDEIAIVTPIAGTTRDHVRATIYIEGVPIHLIDTAGLRETDEAVEKVGIERTWKAIEKAGAALLIAEAGEMAGKKEAEILNRLPPALPVAWVYNKIDLFGVAPTAENVSRETNNDGQHATLRLSALTGEGVESLRSWLLNVAGWMPGGEGLFTARARHIAALKSAAEHLLAAKVAADQEELMAEELRLAHQALCAITGEFTADDLLGEIFGRFCIGK